MAEESGWQWRLCAAICAPPIPKMRLERRTPAVVSNLKRLETCALVCLVLGLIRGGLNHSQLLGDFMGGGTDIFAALLAFLALYDCCMMNGSFLVMLLVWTLTNAILFDLIFSLGPNVKFGSTYMTSPARSAAFIVDNILIIVNALLQLFLAKLSKSILDESVPNWSSFAAWGPGGPPDSGGAQPLLGQPLRPATAQRAPQPTQPLRVFSGSGQRLGGGGGSGRLGSGPGPRNDPRRM